MSQLLLLNPRRRRKARKAPATKRVRRSTRRRNPIANLGAHSPVRRVRRKRTTHHARRRRNPIGGNMRGAGASIVAMLKAAAIGGAGAITMDVVMGQVNGYLPDSLKSKPNEVGVGDAVKAAITVALGQVLAKPTRGLSRQMALGALIVQARDVMSGIIPSTMALGYASPARLIRGSSRIGPMARPAVPHSGIAQYQHGGSPLLSQYQHGGSPLLSGVAQREGIRWP